MIKLNPRTQRFNDTMQVEHCPFIESNVAEGSLLVCTVIYDNDPSHKSVDVLVIAEQDRLHWGALGGRSQSSHMLGVLQQASRLYFVSTSDNVWVSDIRVLSTSLIEVLEKSNTVVEGDTAETDDAGDAGDTDTTNSVTFIDVDVDIEL